MPKAWRRNKSWQACKGKNWYGKTVAIRRAHKCSMDFFRLKSDCCNTCQLLKVVNNTFSSVSYWSCVFVNSALSWRLIGSAHLQILEVSRSIKNSNCCRKIKVHTKSLLNNSSLRSGFSLPPFYAGRCTSLLNIPESSSVNRFPNYFKIVLLFVFNF